jgi:hypothetical protein
MLTTAEVAASAATTTTTATAVVTTTAATATEVAARAIEASAATTTTAWRTVFARTGFVDCESTTIEIFAVELLNGCLSLGIGCHRDEGESAGAASEFILH